MLKIAMAAILMAAPAGQQFDLICTSKTETVRYRVDLARGEWCWEKCDGTMELAAVTSTRITFKQDEDRDSSAYAYVDRVSGKWYQAYLSRRLGNAINEGTCERAAFTGFGDEKAKF